MRTHLLVLWETPLASSRPPRGSVGRIHHVHNNVARLAQVMRHARSVIEYTRFEVRNGRNR